MTPALETATLPTVAVVWLVKIIKKEREKMKEITIPLERYDELLKKEYAVETLKAYTYETAYMSKEVVQTILSVKEPKDDDF